jgi:hypothetical protein
LRYCFFVCLFVYVGVVLPVNASTKSIDVYGQGETQEYLGLVFFYSNSLKNKTISLEHVPDGFKIPAVAVLRHKTCADTFLDTMLAIRKKKTTRNTKSTNNKVTKLEQQLLQEFGQQACLTSNPDAYWMIGYVESGFQPLIIGFGNGAQVRGLPAWNMSHSVWPKRTNADVGLLQINWRANGSRFIHSPFYFFSPTYSIDFIQNLLLPTLAKKCNLEWFYCYHSQNSYYKYQYKDRIQGAKKKLIRILQHLK